MGKGKKPFHKEYTPPEEKFVVVVNAWGRSENRQAYINNVSAWFEIMLRRHHAKEKPQIFRIWWQGTHNYLIVELPDVVTDVLPYLGVHPYTSFLTNAPCSDQFATVYEYNFKRFDHPERRNWKEMAPSYSSIPPNFPVRDPYPLPRDMDLHRLIPAPQPPLNVPYAIPVPAMPATLPPPLPPPNGAEGSKSSTPNQPSSAGHHLPPGSAGLSQTDPHSTSRRSSSRRSPSPNPLTLPSSHPPSVSQRPTPQPAEVPSGAADHSTSAFTPYVPPSHHPAHSILTEARAQGVSQRNSQSKPHPVREERQPQPLKKKMDLDPYEEEDIARKLLSASRQQSEWTPEQDYHEPTDGESPAPTTRIKQEPGVGPILTAVSGRCPSPPPAPVVKPEPSDIPLPPPAVHTSSTLHHPSSSRLESATRSFNSRPAEPNVRPARIKSEHTPPPQPTLEVKREDLNATGVQKFRGPPLSTGTLTGGKAPSEAIAGVGEPDEADYEPSSELLDALADLGEFSGLLGAEASEPNPTARAPTGSHSVPGASNRYNAESEMHASTSQVRVKAEPMDEDRYLGHTASGDQVASAGGGSVSDIRVKPEPLDEDRCLDTSRAKEMPRSDGSSGHYGSRDDYRRHAPHHDRYREEPNRAHRSPDTSRSYGSPQARLRGPSEDGSASSRKRSGREDPRNGHKRVRVKMEPRD